MNLQEALGLARYLIDLGQAKEVALTNPAIPAELRDSVRSELEREENITLEPARFITSAHDESDWLAQVDRSTWYYWPILRQYLLSKRNWPMPSVRSLDETTDRIVKELARPDTPQFDIRGLVLGYVQSGKTANFTATIAKAADSGYRLIIVLSGIDRGLRRQTQIRLKKELVGYSDNAGNAVTFPPVGRQWHEFTTEDLHGDFQPGTADQAALQGPQPVLLVVKKNGAVLRRLQRWLDGASEEVRRTIPVLVIDDESDLASIDTRGSYQPNGEQLSEDEPTDPSVINGCIRGLLNTFQRKAYIAYTATPFANILIPHDTYDQSARNDLYPKDFIVDLPKPEGYFGAEELFGRMDSDSGQQREGLNVIREVSDNDLEMLDSGEVPRCLENAILSFVLAGAARAQRGRKEEPATMLIHASQLIESHNRLEAVVKQKFAEFQDGWRYLRQKGIQQRLNELWDSEFRPVTRTVHPELDVDFSEIEPHIGPFFEAIQVRAINSFTGAVLDYEREPGLKAIAIGGNKLSRGLTLEGLTISFYVRSTDMYDTLMQMGRWFGFRRGYEDLTRIWTTEELKERFTDLAFVEHRLREDIRLYEDLQTTPAQLGVRIWQHPAMQVTSRLKMRFARPVQIAQSYSGQVEQTFKFPLDRLDILSVEAEANRLSVMNFLSSIGSPRWEDKGPMWSGVTEKQVVDFLRSFRQDEKVNSFSLPLVCDYIEHQFSVNELVRWTVVVRRRESKDDLLGEVNWGVPGGHLWQISRTKLNDSSLGVITSPGDEAIGLSADAISKMNEIIQQDTNLAVNVAARRARPPQEGLLLIYPISKNSGQNLTEPGSRKALYDNIGDLRAKDLIGIAISFPHSTQPQAVQEYVEGTVGRPVQ